MRHSLTLILPVATEKGRVSWLRATYCCSQAGVEAR